MRKLICIAAICMLVLCGCSYYIEDDIPKNVWEFSIPCAQESDADNYVITYGEEEIVSDSGEFLFENRNGFDIAIHISADGCAEQIVEMAANGTAVVDNVEKGVGYTVGCHVMVEEGTEMKFIVRDMEK